MRGLTAILAGGGLVLAALSLAVQSTGTDLILRGTEGPVEEAVMPRLLGGWPAPFLADSEGISVPRKLGPEDEFRPLPFLASWSFWYCVLAALRAFAGVMRTVASRARNS